MNILEVKKGSLYTFGYRRFHFGALSVIIDFTGLGFQDFEVQGSG